MRHGPTGSASELSHAGNICERLILDNDHVAAIVVGQARIEPRAADVTVRFVPKEGQGGANVYRINKM